MTKEKKRYWPWDLRHVRHGVLAVAIVRIIVENKRKKYVYTIYYTYK